MTGYWIVMLIAILLVLRVESRSAVVCKKNEVNFLNKCYCEPGWESKTVGTLDCSEPIIENGDCECERTDIERKFLKNDSWFHPQNDLRCTFLCKWNSQVGVPRSHLGEWKDNQVWRQLGFYRKDLPKHHLGLNHLTARLDEFARGYSHWTYLNNTDFGSVIEFGAGGYTQLRNIMEHIHVRVSDVTLVDTQIFDYKEIKGCTYYTGEFMANGQAYPTVLSKLPVEEFSRQPTPMKQYDTVICMNVLVYAQDAFKFLETLFHAVKVGGLLLFHDRWFENPQLSSKCKTAGFTINVIQITREVLDHFLTNFGRVPYFTANQTTDQAIRASQWCHGKDNEPAYWAAIRKVKELD